MPTFPLALSGLSPYGRSALKASPLALGLYSCVALWKLDGDQVGRADSNNGTTPTILDLSGRGNNLQYFSGGGPARPTVNWAGEAGSFSNSELIYGNGLALTRPTADASGFVPTTIVCVARPTNAPGDDRCIFQIHTAQGTAAARFGFYRGASTSLSFQILATGSTVTKLNINSFATDDIYSMVGTSRSKTDHEFVVCNLRTGEVFSATSSTDIGSAIADPTWAVFAAYLYSGNFNDPQIRYTGEINFGAVLARGLATEEMYGLARAPFSLFESDSGPFGAEVAPAEITADLDVTEAADTLVSAVTVQVAGSLNVAEADDALASTTTVDVVGTLAVTDDDDALAASVQVGAGIIGALGDVSITEGDDTLDAAVDLDIYGDLAVTELADTLAAFAAVGGNGPFVRRPFLNLT